MSTEYKALYDLAIPNLPTSFLTPLFTPLTYHPHLSHLRSSLQAFVLADLLLILGSSFLLSWPNFCHPGKHLLSRHTSGHATYRKLCRIEEWMCSLASLKPA